MPALATVLYVMFCPTILVVKFYAWLFRALLEAIQGKRDQ